MIGARTIAGTTNQRGKEAMKAWISVAGMLLAAGLTAYAEYKKKFVGPSLDFLDKKVVKPLKERLQNTEVEEPQPEQPADQPAEGAEEAPKPEEGAQPAE